MRLIILIIAFILANILGGFGLWSTAGVLLWTWYLIRLFEKTNESIAFREFILVLYGLNYLLSPAIALNEFAQVSYYRIKLSEADYFQLAIPAMVCLQIGLYAVKTRIFNIRFETLKIQSFLNQSVLKMWLVAGVVLLLVGRFMPAELAFFVYLLSGIRYVAAFGLFVINRSQYKWHLLAVLAIEFAFSLQEGMFHDLLMWLIFFGLFWMYLAKPPTWIKVSAALGAVLIFFVLQITKSDYRERVGEGESGLAAFQTSAMQNINSESGLFNQKNISRSLTRVNQAWIFASTVNRMRYTKDHQQFAIVGKYAEAAFLPRFIAPDKLKAGDKEIFNRFAGHRISPGTSMGLGMFADGYIAFGMWGVFLFALALGLIFSGVFKIAENWSSISPFFILFIFPILNYAVRPDCETQTIMGHIVKGLFVFSLLMMYYKNYFRKNTIKLMEVTRERNIKTTLNTIPN